MNTILSFLFAAGLGTIPGNHVRYDSTGVYVNSHKICLDDPQENILSSFKGTYVYAVDSLNYIRNGECGFKTQVEEVIEEYSFEHGSVVVVFQDHHLSTICFSGAGLDNGVFNGIPLNTISETSLDMPKEEFSTGCIWAYMDKKDKPILVFSTCKEKSISIFLNSETGCQ